MTNASEVSDDETLLCTECIETDKFKKWIQDNGEIGDCGIVAAHGSQTCVSVKEFAEHVDEWFRSEYVRGEEYLIFEGDSDNPTYYTEGDLYVYIIADQIGCDETLVEMLAPYFPDADARDISQGDEAFYDDTANYESKEDADRRSRLEEEEFWFENRISYQWDEFCNAVQYSNRFFKTKDRLDELFGKPEEYNSGPIKPLYVLKASQLIYRARLLDDDFDEKKLRANPRQELGAPPRNRASAGRMNVELIPVFYGAFSEVTAVAEIRPSIGDSIAVGTFALQTDLTVFDFTAFNRVDVKVRDEARRHTRYDFINEMEYEISKPILPYEKQRQYIATQVVAEYLREYFDCDAVIYRSSMHKADGNENRNIVVFNRGTDFLSEGQAEAVFKLQKYQIKIVENVQYTVMDEIPF